MPKARGRAGGRQGRRADGRAGEGAGGQADNPARISTSSPSKGRKILTNFSGRRTPKKSGSIRERSLVYWPQTTAVPEVQVAQAVETVSASGDGSRRRIARADSL